MTPAFPEPTEPRVDRAAVFLGYLDFYRETMIDKLAGLTEAELRRSLLPSGWTPVQLVKHLTYVERRWLVWGFLGADVGDPRGDAPGGRWAADEPTADLVAALRAQGEVTRAVITDHDLTAVGQPSERWEGADPPTLERICFHLLQEYARHVGQLDVVRELLDGRTGE